MEKAVYLIISLLFFTIIFLGQYWSVAVEKMFREHNILVWVVAPCHGNQHRTASHDFRFDLVTFRCSVHALLFNSSPSSIV